jgi:hypothetical protein
MTPQMTGVRRALRLVVPLAVVALAPGCFEPTITYKDAPPDSHAERGIFPLRAFPP